MNKITICIPDKINHGVSGVYIFSIGEKFYIGRSIDIKKRLSSHCSKLNYYIKNYAIVSAGVLNIQDPMKSLYLPMAKYVLEHPKIVEIEIRYVFTYCSHVEMCAMERSLLRLYEAHPDCINRIFYASIFDRTLQSINRVKICNSVAIPDSGVMAD